MGDMSKEPSMEEILSSIKRIIAEDGDGGKRSVGRRDVDRDTHRRAVVASMVKEADDASSSSYVDEVLELTDEMPRVGRANKMEAMRPAETRTDAAAETDIGAEIQAEAVMEVDIENKADAAEIQASEQELELTEALTEDVRESPAMKTAASTPKDTIVSTESEIAARSSLAALSSMLVKPVAPEPGENTLEGLVREMLRPMMKEWLDANLPRLVEGMVAKEIARITGRTL